MEEGHSEVIENNILRLGKSEGPANAIADDGETEKP
jgi:hypothetical protein